MAVTLQLSSRCKDANTYVPSLGSSRLQHNRASSLKVARGLNCPAAKAWAAHATDFAQTQGRAAGGWGPFQRRVVRVCARLQQAPEVPANLLVKPGLHRRVLPGLPDPAGGGANAATAAAAAAAESRPMPVRPRAAAGLPPRPAAAGLLGHRRGLSGARKRVQVGEPPDTGRAVGDLLLRDRAVKTGFVSGVQGRAATVSRPEAARPRHVCNGTIHQPLFIYEMLRGFPCRTQGRSGSHTECGAVVVRVSGVCVGLVQLRFW